jgi:hypothetical protein
MIAALVLVSSATAQPIIYLQCDSLQRGTPMHYELSLNEAAGTVDWSATSPQMSFPASHERAEFTANAVRFLDTSISRVDLSLERDSTDALGRSYVEKGKCRIDTPPKRQF